MMDELLRELSWESLTPKGLHNFLEKLHHSHMMRKILPFFQHLSGNAKKFFYKSLLLIFRHFISRFNVNLYFFKMSIIF